LLSITVITIEYDIMSCFGAQQTLFNSAVLMQKTGDASLRPLAQHR